MNFDDRKDFMQTVIWLEDRKIRELEINEREGLREPKDWDSEFSKYLGRLECPISWNPEVSTECLNWLVSHAVALEYEENVDSCDGIELGDSGEGNTSDMTNTTKLINKIGQLVERERTAGEGDIEYLSRITKVVQSISASSQSVSRTEVGPVGERASASGPAPLVDPETQTEQQQQPRTLSLDDFPLEFDSGDEVVNRVAVVLKMLHLADLRELQSDVNALVVLCQEFTANPKTNSALGQVGR